MSHLLVAAGVNREAALIRGPGIVAIAGGGDPVGLRAALEQAADGVTGILSFGMAGALVDGLAIGDWVIGDRVTGTAGHQCDPVWIKRLIAALPGAQIGAIHADGRMIGTVAEKAALASCYGALAVDMESHIAAAVASKHGVPFAIARCISDGARHTMPPALTVAMRPDGSINVAAVLGSLATRPGQIAGVARTIVGFAYAMSGLSHGAQSIKRTVGKNGTTGACGRSRNCS